MNSKVFAILTFLLTGYGAESSASTTHTDCLAFVSDGVVAWNSENCHLKFHPDVYDCRSSMVTIPAEEAMSGELTTRVEQLNYRKFYSSYGCSYTWVESCLFELTTQSSAVQLYAYENDITFAARHPNQQYVISSSDDEGSTVSICRTPNGNKLTAISHMRIPGATVSNIDCAPDSKNIALTILDTETSTSHVYLWDGKNDPVKFVEGIGAKFLAGGIVVKKDSRQWQFTRVPSGEVLYTIDALEVFTSNDRTLAFDTSNFMIYNAGIMFGEHFVMPSVVELRRLLSFEHVDSASFSSDNSTLYIHLAAMEHTPDGLMERHTIRQIVLTSPLGEEQLFSTLLPFREFVSRSINNFNAMIVY